MGLMYYACVKTNNWLKNSPLKNKFNTLNKKERVVPWDLCRDLFKVGIFNLMIHHVKLHLIYKSILSFLKLNLGHPS